MCAIVGYVGPRAATSILVEGLQQLESRGYDSAGLAIHDGSSIEIVRAAGKLSRFDEALKTLPGTMGIGHTRWAARGRPVEPNLHPHVVGEVAIVHNGIIENYLALRGELEGAGARFSSDSDTEIVAHLVDRAISEGAGSLHEAVRQAVSRIEGAYAIIAISQSDASRIVAAKNASPLFIGLGENEALCASDISALLVHTRQVIFLGDGEIAELTAAGARIETISGKVMGRAPEHIDWNPTLAEKDGHKHFMLKEIHEQPRAIEDTLRGRIDLRRGDIIAGELSPDIVKGVDRVYLLACGTSHHATIAGKYWIEQLARVPAVAELASEARYREPVFGERDLVIAVSQSGETSDTLAAVEAAKASGAKVIAIANVVDSAIPRLSDGALYTHAGPEVGVASTKCFTSQLAALLLFAVYLGRQKGALDAERARSILQALVEIPSAMRAILSDTDGALEIARRYYMANNVLYLGRGLGFPVALEGALKLKEISYIHAEGYASGEFKHGPIALVDESMPVVMVAARDAHFEKTLSNLEEVRAREGQVIAVATQGDEDVAKIAHHVLYIPEAPRWVLPLLTVLPLQLLAYHMADLKGTDVDQPRNLAKTVTG